MYYAILSLVKIYGCISKPDQNYRDNIAIHRGLLARPKKAGMDGFYSILFFVHRERPLETDRRGYQK